MIRTVSIAGVRSTICRASGERSPLATRTRQPGLRHHRGQLCRGQSRIERVADRAHAHDRIPGLDVRLRIPGQCRHAMAESDSAVPQRRRDAQAARPELRVRHSIAATAVPPGHDFGSRMPLGCVIEEPVQRQREFLHGSIDHQFLTPGAGAARRNVLASTRNRITAST